MLVPLISVIVPIYNSEKYLDRCLKSICNQTYRNLEIILINDGSTDSSLEICKNWQEQDERIILINSENKGVSESRNKGLEIAKGDYISFVDSDDYLNKDCYKILIENSRDFDVIVFNYYNVFDNRKLFGISSRIECDYLTELYKNNVKGYLWNKLYSKSALFGIKFDKEINMCEDLLFNYCVACNKKIRYCYVDFGLYYYVHNNTSAVNNFYNDITKFLAYIKIIELLADPKMIEQRKVEFIISYSLFKINNCNVSDEYVKEYNKKYLEDIIFRKSSIRNKVKVLFILLLPKTYFKLKTL